MMHLALNEEQLIWATHNIESLAYQPGAPIIREGMPPDNFYIITKGRVDIVLQTPGGSEIVVADGGADTQAVGRRARTVTIRLQNEITAIPAGSRLRVTLGARSTVQNVGNLVYLIPVPDGSTATVGKVTLTVPVLPKPVSR